MKNVLFLQSEVIDPYEIYANMLEEHPLYYDRENNCWAVYSFDDCHAILKNSAAYIPETKVFTTESDEVKTVIRNLARLTNPPHHTSTREAASALLKGWKIVEVSGLIHDLIGGAKKPATLDWVGEVGKKLPALALLKGFDFSPAEIDLILPEVENLVTLMLPVRSADQNIAANRSVSRIFNSINSFLARSYGLKHESDIHLYAANLIGLLIQSYDAGRGLLSNSLLQLLPKESGAHYGADYFERSVRETLRFDPPVHNTRRVLTEPVVLRDQLLAAGENILIILAAANRDPRRFNDPHTYTIFRRETPAYLSYGAGPHQCIAEHFSVHLTTGALHYLYSKYDRITCIEPEIHYEPRVNVRLPVSMNLVIS